MKRLIFIALSIILLAQYSCKKVQPEMKVLDCSCAKEVSANFTIEEIVAGSFPEDSTENFWTYTDTIFSEKTARFTALEQNANYKWYVGNEIVNQKQLKRYFSLAFENQSIPITLVVKKKPNKICFPNDDGFDSITKLLTIKSAYDTTFLEGNFRFYNTELKDSFDVKIDFQPGGISDGPFFNMYNYDGMGSNSINILKRFANYFEAFGANLTPQTTPSPSVRFKYISSNRFKFTLYYGQFINENYKDYYGRKL